MPVEVDVMAPPQRVAARVARWEEALDALVPARVVRSNIRIATWNLRVFGGLTKAWTTPEGASPMRNFTDVHLIAAVIRRFDVVAVQEVRGDLRALRHLMKVLGDDWAFILTDVTKGADKNPERLAFLFNTHRVKPSGLACELVVPLAEGVNVGRGELDRQFARTPYAVSFLSQGQTFTLVTLHVVFGKAADRVPELRAIAQWLADWAEQEFDWDHNLIALGDFNIDRAGDPLFKAFTSTGLAPAPHLDGLPRTIFHTGEGGHFYDQIAWFNHGQEGRPVLTLEAVAGGHADFVPELRGNRTLKDLSFHISDHYPLWVEFAAPTT
ncbi:endonuclease/exonuclease/phosphatase family protein [Streptomyces sp. Y7]|uniref:endonuclease/exonuclease/phosphatase family protein n=1 Tax=Streptomyces sp. Y7 TaxID=3342392 RepID=UPI003713864C